jgi:hypothetical protein
VCDRTVPQFSPTCPWPLLAGSLKTRRMARWTAKWVLAKNAVLSEHGDTLGSAPLALVGFLGAHAVSDKARTLGGGLYVSYRTLDEVAARTCMRERPC